MSRLLIIAVTAATLPVGAGVVRAERTYRVLIDSSPRGAKVYLGSKDDGAVGETPYHTRLPEGVQPIVLELDGYATSKRLVEVERTRRLQKFEYKLERRRTGTVSVSVPSGDAAVGAVVKIDGVEVGTAPDEFTVDIGPHVVEVVAPGFDTAEEWIEVEEGATTTVEPELDEASGGGDVEGGDGGDGGGGDDGGKRDRHEDAGVHHATPRAVGELASAMVVVDTGVDIGGRHYSYSGVVTDQNLRPYDADGVPLAHVGAELYPLAGAGIAALRMIGVAGSFDRSLSLSSSTNTSGIQVPTTWSELEIGARLRYPLGAALLGAGVGYGQVAVLFYPPPETPLDLAEQVPEVDYRYIRLGADARYDSGRIGAFGGASVLMVRSSGASAERFRGHSTTGYGLRAGFAVGVVPRIEARVTGRYDVFDSSFVTQDGDQYVADGANDRVYGVVIGAAYIY